MDTTNIMVLRGGSEQEHLSCVFLPPMLFWLCLIVKVPFQGCDVSDIKMTPKSKPKKSIVLCRF